VAVVDVLTISYDPLMARDIGGYFEKMTQKARGGRRLEADSSNYDTSEYDSGEAPAPAPSRSTPTSSRGGGLADVLKDVLARGRTTAKTTADKAREQVTKRTTKPTAAPKPSAGRNLPPEGVVAVEYSPRLDGDPDPGEVVWTWVPFEEDPEQGKDRPVVVIGRRGKHLVGVPLTTKQSDREAQIAIGTGEWDPKRRESYARIWRMLDIDEDATRREGSILDRKRFDFVVQAVDQYYDVTYPAPDAKKSAPMDYDY
jgi:hypothetical protein